jgi:putative transposon-encoded protein
MYIVNIWYINYIAFCSSFPDKEPIYTMYIQPYVVMVRRMIATITQIESVVTPSGNSGHVVIPKAWIGKEAIVTLKENRVRGKK